MMPSREDIEQQRVLLATYRRTLQVYLKQRAALGEAHITPGIANGIYEARAGIRHIKKILRDWRVPVDDHPLDEEISSPELSDKRPPSSTPNTYRVMRKIVKFVEDINMCLRNKDGSPIPLSLQSRALQSRLLDSIAMFVTTYNESRAVLPHAVDRLIRPYKNTLINGFPFSSSYANLEMHLYLMRLEDSKKYLLRQSERIVKQIRRELQPEWYKWAERLLIVGIGSIVILAIIAYGPANLVAFTSETLGRQFSTILGLNGQQNNAQNNLPFEISAILEQETKTVLNNRVFVTVTSITPVEQKVSVVVGVPGQDNSTIEFQAVGTAHPYLNLFEFRLTKIATSSFRPEWYAEFIVTDLTKSLLIEAKQPTGMPQTISLEERATLSVFDGRIAITVFSLDPRNQQVVAIIGQPGAPD